MTTTRTTRPMKTTKKTTRVKTVKRTKVRDGCREGRAMYVIDVRLLGDSKASAGKTNSRRAAAGASGANESGDEEDEDDEDDDQE